MTHLLQARHHRAIRRLVPGDGLRPGARVAHRLVDRDLGGRGDASTFGAPQVPARNRREVEPVCAIGRLRQLAEDRQDRALVRKLTAPAPAAPAADNSTASQIPGNAPAAPAK